MVQGGRGRGRDKDRDRDKSRGRDSQLDKVEEERPRWFKEGLIATCGPSACLPVCLTIRTFSN